MARRKSRYSGIGGQAVLEGVMMKNKEKYAVAVRKPDGEIEVEVETYQGLAHGSKFKELPFIRGIFNFLDSLILGTRALNYSASFYEEEEGKEQDERWQRRKAAVRYCDGDLYYVGSRHLYRIAVFHFLSV